MRKCIVTGGSGFIGIELVRRLRAEGCTVTIYDVTDPDAPDLEGQVGFVRGDVRDAAKLREAARGCDSVFHIAAVVPLTRAGRGFHEINVGGTRNAVEAARAAGAESFVHLSSSAIYGPPRSGPLDETTPLDPLGRYGASKAEGERVAQAARGGALSVAVIRPRTVIGPGRLGIFDLLFEWIHTNSPMFLIGRGDKPFQLVSNRDLVEAMLLAARVRADTELNVGTDRFRTLREDLDELAERVGSRSRVLGFPAWIARPALQTLDLLRLSPLVDFHYKTVDKEFWFDISRARELLGWQPRDSNVEMLEQSYAWYVAERERPGRGSGPFDAPLPDPARTPAPALAEPRVREALLLAMARPLLPESPKLDNDERARVERELESFLAAEVGAMPGFLRRPYLLMLALFDWLPVVRYGRRYGSLTRERQRRIVLAWSRSRIGRLRDFVKLVRSCALYFYLDHPLVLARLEEEAADPAARTDASRAH